MTAPEGAIPVRRLIVLGSTGSIGTNTLSAVEHLHARTPYRYEVAGLAGGKNGELLAAQAARFNVRCVAIADGERDRAMPMPGGAAVYRGPHAAAELIDAVARPGDLVMAAMVGSAGLPAVVRAIERGCDILLANKETLVAAGAIVMPLARAKGVRLIPVDSEHSAVFQCLHCGRSMEEVRRVVLTASGGPFRHTPREQLRTVTVEDALNHPTWRMGAKVTIDSATLMNKGLEVIEAHHLFGLESTRIDAIIHPQSIVHSFVEFIDGSIFAQLSPPDMKSPIQYALTWPARAEGCSRRLDWSALRGLEFQPIDGERFPAIDLARTAVDRGGTAGAVFNAANEAAVAAFLDRRLPFDRIAEVVRRTIDLIPSRAVRGLDDVMEADREARAFAEGLCGSARPAFAAAPGA